VSGGIPAQYLHFSTFQPTFLYELIFDFAWAGMLVWLGHHRRIKPPGLLFRFFDFFLEKSGTGCSIFNAVFLEMTFAGLVANRAVQGMID
jgi:hypothetical protein